MDARIRVSFQDTLAPLRGASPGCALRACLVGQSWQKPPRLNGSGKAWKVSALASQHSPIKNGARGNGASHARYIAGEGKFAERDDVAYLEDGNLPDWAKDAEEFFAAADEHERGDYTRKLKNKDGEEYTKTIKGRAYKEMEVAIPREAPDPVKWAKDFARESIGNKHPYRLAVHDKEASDGGRNVHMHLMFSTRTMDGHQRDKETFFKRAAAPYRDRKTKELMPANPAKGGAKKSEYWDSQVAIHDHRARFERAVQRVAPEFKMQRSDAPEQKIGPKLSKAGPEYERQREERAANVSELREAKRERRDIDAEIKREQEIESRLTKAKEAGELERKQSAPQSQIIDTGTDIEQAKREQAKPRSNTDELFAQLLNQRQEREASRKDKENPLSDILQKWQAKADEARPKPEEPTHDKEKSKMFQPLSQDGAEAPKQEQAQQAQEQARDQQQAQPQQAQEQPQQQPERSRTDDLFAQLEKQQKEREQRDRDGGPELSR